MFRDMVDVDIIKRIKENSMNKIEKIRRKIEALLNDWKYGSSIEAKYMCEAYMELLKYIDFLQEEPVSEELEEAANAYAVTVYNNYLDNPKAFENIDADTLNEDAFKAGAKWQKVKDRETIELAEDHAMFAGMEKMKEQMMKDAIGGYVIEDIEEGNGDFLLSADYIPASMGLKDQQKVKVIILKDE